LFEFELVGSPDRFKALKPDWDALWLRCSDSSIFLSFDCCLKIWESIAEPAGRKLLCLVGWENGRLIAVWPLVIYRKLAWTCIRPLEANDAEFSDILIDDTSNRRDWTNAAWQVLKAKSGSDVMVLPYFPRESEVTGILHPHVTRSDQYVVIHLKSEKDWDTYYNSLSKNHRRNHTRARRRLVELGTIDCEVIGAGDRRVPDLVLWMLVQKRIWAERTNKKGSWLYDEGFRDFLIRLVVDPEAKPKCLIMSLTLNDTPIAVQIYAPGQSTLYALISGFDAHYQKYSPGILLREYLVKWAMHHKLDCNLGLGAEQYKKFWSRNEVLEATTYHLAVSWWGKAALRARSLRQQLKAGLPVEKAARRLH
jgi:CelD/BcsL family acetyltransferase involved in cellulose biosynthesis